MVPLGSYEEDLYVCVFPPVPIFEGPVIAGIGGRFAFLVVSEIDSSLLIFFEVSST